MFIRVLLVLALWCSSTTTALAECVDIIKASALRGTVVQGSASLDAEARNFCSEYSSLKSNNKSLNLSGSYSGIGIGVGSSSGSVQQAASKYCDASDSTKTRDSSYEQYVESIAPGAYSAYVACINSDKGIVASLSPIAIGAKDIVVVVSNRTNGAATQTIAFTATPGLSCSWNKGVAKDKSGDALLKAGAATSIQCTRSNEAQAGSLTIVGTTQSNSSYTFEWKKFQGGIPIDELQAIKLANLQLVNSMGTAIVAFNSDRCPAGWGPMPALAGRSVIGAGSGLNLTTRKNGEIGGTEMHALTVAEMPAHSHSYTFTNHQHTPVKGDPSDDEFDKATTPANTSETGGGQAHNNMHPFMVLQYCQRS